MLFVTNGLTWGSPNTVRAGTAQVGQVAGGWPFEYPSAGSARETNLAFDLVDSQRRGNRASAILITGAAGRGGGVRRRLTELLLNQGITMRAVV